MSPPAAKGRTALATSAAVLGYALLLMALLADPAGVGGQAGLGWKQLAAALAGGVVGTVGFALLLRERGEDRGRLLVTGAGAVLIAVPIAADQAGWGKLELGSPHLYVIALGVLVVLLAGERG